MSPSFARRVDQQWNRQIDGRSDSVRYDVIESGSGTRVREWHLRRRCLKQCSPAPGQSRPAATGCSRSSGMASGCLDRGLAAARSVPPGMEHDRSHAGTLHTSGVCATLDGELVAFGEDGTPDFPLLCERMLMPSPVSP
jgi:hypothetical protein